MAVNPVVESVIRQQIMSEANWVQVTKVIRGKEKEVTVAAPTPGYCQKSDAHIVNALKSAGFNYTEEEVRRIREELAIPNQFIRNTPAKKYIKL